MRLKLWWLWFKFNEYWLYFLSRNDLKNIKNLFENKDKSLSNLIDSNKKIVFKIELENTNNSKEEINLIKKDIEILEFCGILS